MKEIAKSIHFGWFLRSCCDEKGWTVAQLADEAEVTEQTLFRLFKMRKPRSYGRTIVRLAKAFGFNASEFDAKWRSTPVSQPTPKRVPLTQQELWANFDKAVARLARTKQTTDEEIIAEAAKRLRVVLAEPSQELEPTETLAPLPAPVSASAPRATETQERADQAKQFFARHPSGHRRDAPQQEEADRKK